MGRLFCSAKTFLSPCVWTKRAAPPRNRLVEHYVSRTPTWFQYGRVSLRHSRFATTPHALAKRAVAAANVDGLFWLCIYYRRDGFYLESCALWLLGIPTWFNAIVLFLLVAAGGSGQCEFWIFASRLVANGSLQCRHLCRVLFLLASPEALAAVWENSQ